MSVLPKVFEAIVHTQLFVYLQDNSLLHSAQSGFRSLHNTQHVLLRSVDDWRTALDRDEIVGTILIDLSKAFDSIDHNLLVAKLEAYGVRGNEKEWFLNYLSDRQQRVVVGGAKLTWSEMVKGVPQGSILGPLLFTIFMNDFPSVIENCNVNLYADDTTIYFSSKDPQEVQNSADGPEM